MGELVGQVVQFNECEDNPSDNTEENITNNMIALKKKIYSLKARSEECVSSKCSCKNIQEGLIRALKSIKRSDYLEYHHRIIIIGDYPNHLDHEDCQYAGTDKVDQIENTWNLIYQEILSIPNRRIIFLPLGCGQIVNTMRRMQSRLGSYIVTQFAKATTTSQNSNNTPKDSKQFIGIT